MGSNEGTVRGVILANVDDRLREVEKNGCPAGRVRGEKVHNIEAEIGEIKGLLSKVYNLLWGGVLAVVLLAFFAGVQVWQDALNLLLR
jgi:hypothetical protein